MLFEGKRFRLGPNERTYIMGVLNVTPDSFSDGGAYTQTEAAIEHALRMQRDGADIIDVGAESTAPGHVPVPPAQEIERLQPILPVLCAQLDVPVSVDTRHPETAAWALAQGAAIINDVSGVLCGEMAEAVQRHEAGWIVTHGMDADSSGADDPLPQIAAFFAEAVRFAEKAGLRRTQLCLDPGIGFGKSRTGDLRVLRDLRLLQAPCAILVGASRKRVIGTVSGETDPLRRLPGTIAAHTAAIAGGADVLRVHDVAESVQAARVADALYRTQKPQQPGKILLRDLHIFGFHGVNPEEKTYGQTFLADVEMETDFAAAITGDNVGETVSYAQAAKTLQKALTETRYDLIETAADAAVRALFCAYPAIRRIRLRLKKPDAPMKAQCAWAAVEIERKRDA